MSKFWYLILTRMVTESLLKPSVVSADGDEVTGCMCWPPPPPPAIENEPSEAMDDDEAS